MQAGCQKNVPRGTIPRLASCRLAFFFLPFGWFRAILSVLVRSGVVPGRRRGLPLPPVPFLLSLGVSRGFFLPSVFPSSRFVRWFPCCRSRCAWFRCSRFVLRCRGVCRGGVVRVPSPRRSFRLAGVPPSSSWRPPSRPRAGVSRFRSVRGAAPFVRALGGFRPGCPLVCPGCPSGCGPGVRSRPGVGVGGPGVRSAFPVFSAGSAFACPSLGLAAFGRRRPPLGVPVGVVPRSARPLRRGFRRLPRGGVGFRPFPRAGGLTRAPFPRPGSAPAGGSFPGGFSRVPSRSSCRRFLWVSSVARPSGPLRFLAGPRSVPVGLSRRRRLRGGLRLPRPFRRVGRSVAAPGFPGVRPLAVGPRLPLGFVRPFSRGVPGFRVAVVAGLLRPGGWRRPWPGVVVGPAGVGFLVVGRSRRRAGRSGRGVRCRAVWPSGVARRLGVRPVWRPGRRLGLPSPQGLGPGFSPGHRPGLLPLIRHQPAPVGSL
jgi:hypothetical protein